MNLEDSTKTTVLPNSQFKNVAAPSDHNVQLLKEKNKNLVKLIDIISSFHSNYCRTIQHLRLQNPIYMWHEASTTITSSTKFKLYEYCADNIIDYEIHNIPKIMWNEVMTNRCLLVKKFKHLFRKMLDLCSNNNNQ